MPATLMNVQHCSKVMFAQWMDETGDRKGEPMFRVELGVGRTPQGGSVIPELGGSGEAFATEHKLLGRCLSQKGSLRPCDFTSLSPSHLSSQMPSSLRRSKKPALPQALLYTSLIKMYSFDPP